MDLIDNTCDRKIQDLLFAGGEVATKDGIESIDSVTSLGLFGDANVMNTRRQS